MTAYKKEELNNLLVHETAREAFYEGLIDEATYTNILQRHPGTLYTPNFFIRLGLALLTIVIGLATLILFALFLFSGNSGEGAYTVLLVMLAIISYIALELLVNAKKYYNAGTDNVLMLLTVGFTWGAYAFSGPAFNYWATTVLCVISAWLCYRFTNGLMGMVAYIFLLISLYNMLYLQVINAIPFVLMAASAVVYWITKKLCSMPAYLYHRQSIAYINLLAIVSFYVCSNYYFVSNVVAYRTYLNDQPALTVPIAPFFWFCTLFIPIGYLLYGIRAKSLLFIRCGIILLAAGIATLRYYYAFMPGDVLLMLGGVILIAVSSMLIVYVRQQRRSFVLGNSSRQTPEHLRNIEALVIAQAVSTGHTAAPQQGVQFGGGNSGGGGATGDY